jgi:hypothetical protein
MVGRLYRQERWSAEDDQLLRSMSQAGKSLTLMTAKLKKPMSSIRSRAQELHIHIPGTSIGKRSA